MKGIKKKQNKKMHKIKLLKQNKRFINKGLVED